MGNQSSEFQTQFYKRYSFVQVVNDKHFNTVKIYRKNTLKFDYIMIVQIQLSQMNDSQISQLKGRLKQIKNFQNQTTLRVYYYKFLDPYRIYKLVIYAEYMNRSVDDYLVALRSSPNFVFQVNEIMYVLKNISKSCLTLKKMGITQPDLSSTKIYISPEGQALLCPLLYVLNSLKGLKTYNQLQNLQNKYRKYSISTQNSNPFETKQQIKTLLLQMSGNLSTKRLKQMSLIFKLLHQSVTLQQFYLWLPQVDTQTMKIQQMHRLQNIPYQLQDIS